MFVCGEFFALYIPTLPMNENEKNEMRMKSTDFVDLDKNHCCNVAGRSIFEVAILMNICILYLFTLIKVTHS